MSFYDELKQPSEDLEVLAGLIQAVHKSSDIEEIYRIALDSVIELENVDLAMIYLIDEEKREAVLKAHRNVTEDYIRRAERIPYPKGITWKAINSDRVINIEDAQKDPDTGPAGRDLGHHSNLSIPIIMEGKVIGVIWFGSYKERRFDEREVNLLSTLGNQIAIAIAKAKRTEELEQAQKKLKERNRNLSILSAISQAVHRSADLNQIYRTLLDVTEDLKFIDLISLYLVEGVGDKREAVIQIHRGYPEEYLKKASRIPYPKGNVWKVIESGKSVFYEDASDSSTPVGPAGKALGQRSLLS
ncbi:MAG: GAF domain-containing protein, partial [Thermodesulfobacteriota bacterium]